MASSRPNSIGTYVRTGPNPLRRATSTHWFFGDGMVHGVRLANGKAEWYRNRFVRTPNITDPLDDPMAGIGDLARGTGNTHVLPHNGEHPLPRGGSLAVARSTGAQHARACRTTAAR